MKSAGVVIDDAARRLIESTISQMVSPRVVKESAFRIKNKKKKEARGFIRDKGNRRIEKGWRGNYDLAR